MCEKPAWIKIHWNSIWLRTWSHMASHYTCGSVTTLHDFGGVLGRPLDTFFWALTISWSRLLARMWRGPWGRACNGDWWAPNIAPGGTTQMTWHRRFIFSLKSYPPVHFVSFCSPTMTFVPVCTDRLHFSSSRVGFPGRESPAWHFHFLVQGFWNWKRVSSSRLNSEALKNWLALLRFFVEDLVRLW